MAVATTILFLGIFIPTSAAFQDQALQLKSRQQQSSGTPLFLDEPSCDFYQCAITYYPGDNATAHWTDAPSGNVILEMRESFSFRENGCKRMKILLTKFKPSFFLMISSLFLNSN